MSTQGHSVTTDEQADSFSLSISLDHNVIGMGAERTVLLEQPNTTKYKL